MKRPGFALSLICAAALIGTGVFAQDAPAIEPTPGRELFSTSAGVTEPAVLNFNGGFQGSYGRDRTEARRFPTQLALGLTPWFDLRLAWSGPNTLKDVQGARQAGGGDPLIGGQAQFLRQGSAGLDLGLAYWHKLPRASVKKGIGTGKADDTLLLTATRTFGCWEVDLNAGANWLGRPDAEGAVRQGQASMALTRAIAPGWSVSLDTLALAGTVLGPRSITSLVALSRNFTSSLTVDLGVEAGLTRDSERMAIDAGLTWRMGRLWGQD